MKENRFEYVKLPMLIALGGGVSEKPNKDEISLAALKGIHSTYQSTPESYWRQIALSRGVVDQVTIDKMKTLAYAHECMVMSYDVIALHKGVVVHVRDTRLVEALMRTDVDAAVGDMKMPFPIVELAFPSGLSLDGVHEVTGCLMVDMDEIKMEREFKSMNAESVDECMLLSNKKAKYIIMSAIKKMGDDTPADEILLKFGPDEMIDNLPMSPDMSDVEKVAISKLAKLACSLFLYLQGVERDKTMLPIQYSKEMTHGMPANLARLDKKRGRYVIRDILPSPHRLAANHGGHHASPDIHWRRGHMRVLRDERFKRNPDNSIKSVWVRPCLVATGEDEEVTAERVLECREA